MANSIKLESCPDCGAVLAANLVKLLRTDPVNYRCPNGGVVKRKEWERIWGEDFVAAENKAQLDAASADYLDWVRGDDIDDEMNDQLTADFARKIQKETV